MAYDHIHLCACLPHLNTCADNATTTTLLARQMRWHRKAQVWIDNDLKIIQGTMSPGQGCVVEVPWLNASNDVMPLLFNEASAAEMASWHPNQRLGFEKQGGGR